LVNHPGKPPTVSIVTVVRNDADGLRRTADSLRRQGIDHEWLVLDGGSTDGTSAMIASLRPRPTWFRSRPDGGPFDAMNEGLARARGRHVLFLNAGDWLLPQGLDRLVAATGGYEDRLILGDSVEDPGDGILRRKPARHPRWAWYGMPAHHCAILYPRRQIQDLTYRTDLRVASDYAFTLLALRRAGGVHHVKLPVAGFAKGGRSRVEADRGRAEQEQIRRHILCMPSSFCMLIRVAQWSAAMLRQANPSFYARLRFNRTLADHPP